MPIRLNGSTSGYTEINNSAVGTNNTITLPGANPTTNGSFLLGATSGQLSFSTDPTLTSLNGGPLAGFRNRIINGDFDFWQRGTSFTWNEYCADRWLHIRIGTTHTVTRQPFTLGQTAVPGEPTYFCSTVVSSVAGAGNNAQLVQFIEDVRTFAGQQVTVSFWAKVDATKNIAVDFFQNFGTGGSPSAAVSGIGAAKISIGTSWQKVTVTASVPSISGKTLGTDSNSSLNVNIFFDAGSDFNARTDNLGHQSGTFDIAQVQIEPGPVATPFEQRPIGTELALCQRYFEKSHNIDVVPGTNVGLSGSIEDFTIANQSGPARVRCAVSKRRSPTVNVYDATGNVGFITTFTPGQNNFQTASAVDNHGMSGFKVFMSQTNLVRVAFHWTADAEL